MDWATERKLPTKLYLEFEDQPDKRTGKTKKEDIQKNMNKE